MKDSMNRDHEDRKGPLERKRMPGLTLLFASFLAFFLLQLMPLQSRATHAVGADLTYECTGNPNEYIIKLSFYRDCEGIAPPECNFLGCPEVEISSDNCGESLTVEIEQVDGTGNEVTPICSDVNTTCSGGSLPGIEEYVYTGKVTLPQECTDWTVGFTENARNAAITNIENSDQQDLHVEANINNTIPCNNSPQFKNKPVPFICQGQPFCFNHGANDVEGDSLSYQLIVPKNGPNGTVTYKPPYSKDQPLDSDPPVTFDTTNGQLCMTPQAQEVTVVAVRVDQYNSNGDKIGHVIRDIQINVRSCSNQSPVLGDLDGKNITDSIDNRTDTSVCAGTKLDLEIEGSDPDSDDTLSMTWDQGIADGNFSTNGQPPTGTFTWQTDQSDISSTYQCFTVQIQDDNCPYKLSFTQAYCIKVTGVSVELGSDTSVNCGDSANVTASVSGGIEPYTYDWSNGDTTQTAKLGCGQHILNVTDSVGCKSSDTIMVDCPTGFDVSTSTNEATCPGVCDGSATANPGGGVTPYSYTWYDDNMDPIGQTTQTATGLCADSTYIIEVEDDVACIGKDTVTIGASQSVDFDLSSTDLLCYQDSSGVIDFTSASGGAGDPYDFTIDNGNNSWTKNGQNPTFNGLPAGTYDIAVSDSVGCVDSGQVVLDEPDPVKASSEHQDALCNGDCNGEIRVSASGGTPPYQYSNDSGNTFQNDSAFTGLCVGEYQIVVEDANGCTTTLTDTVAEPDPLSMSFSTFDATCNGRCDGNAVVIPNGGTAPYTFKWSNGIAGPDDAEADSLCAGNYSLTLEDTNGCSIDTSFTIGEPSAIDVTIDSTVNASCNGASDGFAKVSASGGSTPYAGYEWSDGQTGPSASGLPAGTHTCVVTDDNGCQDSVQVTIDEPSAVQLSVSPDTTICISDSATISASANGGAGTPYDFHWDQGLGNAPSHTVGPNSSTTYEVYAEDANGCFSDTQTVTVDLYPPLNVTAKADTTICPGGTATLSASGSGGNGDHTYTWSNGVTGQSITVSPGTAKDYVVTLDDGCGTPAVTDTVRVEIGEVPDVQLSGQNLEGCYPVTATFENQTPPAQVGDECFWDFGDTTTAKACDSVTHTYDEPGCYDVSLTVTSPAGCSADTMVTNMVCAYPYPKADFIADPQRTSILTPDPEVDLINKSTGAESFEWEIEGQPNTTATDTSINFPNDYPDKYEVCLKAESKEGCRDSTCKKVVIEGEFQVFVPNAFSPDGDGDNDHFYPVVRGYDETEFSFYVFDRWGDIVFESHHPDEKWDGTVKGSAEQAKPDVYVWKLVTRDKYTGVQKEFTGHVTLLR